MVVVGILRSTEWQLGPMLGWDSRFREIVQPKSGEELDTFLMTSRLGDGQVAIDAPFCKRLVACRDY